MKGQIECEVIPVWYMDAWRKLNCEKNSAIDVYLERLIKDWRNENI